MDVLKPSRKSGSVTQPGAAERTIDERGIEVLGAPPGGWDTDIKKVKDIDWKHGEQITQDLWESLHPKVARDFYQQLGNHLYALLTVWLGGAFKTLVRSVPNADGFGLFELLLAETQVVDGCNPVLQRLLPTLLGSWTGKTVRYSGGAGES